MSFFEHINTKLPYLSEQEIHDFINSHSWLENDCEDNILFDYLTAHFQSKIDHNKSILEKLKISQNPTKIIEENKNEDKKIELEQKEQKNDDLIMEIISFLDTIRLILDGDNFNYNKHFEFLYTNLNNIYENPNDQNLRQITINKIDFLLYENLIEIFEKIGFQKIEIEENIMLFYSDLINDTWKTIIKFIDEDYLRKENKDIDFSRKANADKMAQIYENRLQNKTNNINYNNNSIYNNKKSYIDESKELIKEQLNEYRNKMKQKNFQQKPFGNNVHTFSQIQDNNNNNYNNFNQQNTSYNNKMITISDIENKRNEENKSIFSKKSLEYTNEFRKQQGLKPVEFNSQLHDIGLKHSKDMSEGKVPFGHQGFNNRVSSITFSHGLVCENVAYCSSGYEDIPRTIVNGWINSPGHRKNLLSDSNVCGISVYRGSNGNWYFTQLLARKL